MSVYSSLVGGALHSALPVLLPLVRRRTNAQLLSLVPKLPIPLGEQGWRDLRSAIGRDSIHFFFNFLRHVDRRCASIGEVRQRLDSYLAGPVLRSEEARRRIRRQLGLPGLGSIIISPTVECSESCDLCYNREEIHPESGHVLDGQVLDRVVGEAKELGAYRVSLIGGEPLLVWRSLVALIEKHDDVLFTVLTNGLLLDDEMAGAFAALGNVELSFSVDGLCQSHDAVRGRGTFDRVLDAMRLYRDAGGMLLFSPTVTAANHRELLGDEFLDLMSGCGAYMGYFHHYDMVGGQAEPKHLLTPSQLAWMDDRIREIHAAGTLSILSNVVTDLLTGGCKAVREFVHVNHKGQVEPCCMVPFAADSVVDKPLVEVLRSGFFGRLEGTGADDGGVRRCFIGENLSVLQEAVGAGEAFPTTASSQAVFAHLGRSYDGVFPTCFSREPERSASR
jgi:MoaA/NifB/PqqE/SkfB family radical SAM enzyme